MIQDSVTPNNHDMLQLDAGEVRLRKAFLEFGEQDIAALMNLHRQLNDEAEFFVEAFYAHLLAFDKTAAFLRDEKQLARLKQAQADYFTSLIAGNYDDAYIQNRIKVGVAHERVGLPPNWYIGAYNKYLNLMLPRIWQLFGTDSQEALEATLALLKIISLDMSIAIDTYSHMHQRTIQNKLAQLAALNEVATLSISSSPSLLDVLDKIMQQGISLTGSQAACIAFYNHDSGLFEDWHTQGLSEHFVNNMVFRPGGLADETFTTGSYILSNDRPESKHKLSKLAHEEGLQSFICLPLTCRTNPLGVLYFYRTDRDMFHAEEIHLLTTFANLAAAAIEHAKTTGQATTDALTGLLNRRALDDFLNGEILQAQRYGSTFSFMMLDIDHFKEVNDTYGHAAGDAVLKALARILKQEMREVDRVARYGGEEFTIITPATKVEFTSLVAERIREKVEQATFTLPNGKAIRLTISIGISGFTQHGNCKPETLLEQADQAMYTAKQNGRNQVLEWGRTEIA